MKRYFFLVFNFLFILFLFIYAPLPSFATQYNLIAPSGQLTRGQNIQFTITVDTEGKTLSSISIGMAYDKSVLQYVQTDVGNTFTTVQATPQDSGPASLTDTNLGNVTFSQPASIIFDATSDAGYSGSGNLAVVTFKLIATSAGSTDLCVLFSPSPTPTLPSGSTPAPTSLPKSGSTEKTNQGAIAGIAFLLLAGAGIAIINRQPLIPTTKKKRTHGSLK